MTSEQTRRGVAGIILAGGQSRRMGRDKALLPVPGQPSLTFVEHLASLLAQSCQEVLLVARDQTSGKELFASATRHDWRLVYDQIPDQGPLMGLLSGLQATPYSHALVLAVDLPFAQPALLAWLAALPLTDELLVPHVQDIPQVLLARYPRALLPIIEDCLRTGRRDPRALLSKVPVRYLEEAQLRETDPELRSFANINTPEDLAQTSELP